MLFILSFVSFNNAIGNNNNISYLNLKNENQLNSLAKLTIDLANDIYCRDIQESDCDDCFDFINDSKYSNGNVIKKINAEGLIPKTIIYDFNGNDNISKIRIIAIRGTHTKREWKNNFDFIEKHGKDLGINIDGWFHPGYANSSIILWNKIRKYIIKCEYPVVLTGHSRGASISEIIHVIAKEKNPKQPIYCMSYGPSPPMILYKNVTELTNDIYVFINENDPIPRITMKNLLNIKFPFSWGLKIGSYLRIPFSFLSLGKKTLTEFFKALSELINDSHKNYAIKEFVENFEQIIRYTLICIKNPEKCRLSNQVGRVFRLQWVDDKSTYPILQRGCMKKSLFDLELNKDRKDEIPKINDIAELEQHTNDHKPRFYRRVLHVPVCEPSNNEQPLICPDE